MVGSHKFRLVLVSSNLTSILFGLQIFVLIVLVINVSKSCSETSLSVGLVLLLSFPLLSVIIHR
jgi:hypothetical protein